MDYKSGPFVHYGPDGGLHPDRRRDCSYCTQAPERIEPGADRWSRIRSDEHLALCRVEMQAREAVDIARAAGVHLGPLHAALEELAAVRAR